MNSILTIKINVNHLRKDGTKVNDMEQLEIPVTIAERTFTVTFVMDGGKITDSNNISRETIELVEDSLIFNGLTYSKPGYRFDGWFTAPEFNSDSLFSADGVNAVMPSRNITLYAKWSALSYNVNFDANGGTVNTASITALSDVALGTLPVPARTYYTFNGWFTAPSGGEKVTSDSKFARTEDITLYAQWTLNSFVITLDTNGDGATVSTGTIRAYCGKKIGELPTPTRNYYTFAGWYTSASDGEKVTSSSVYDVAKDITIYAHWNLKPVSGWVVASSVPAGAQIVNTKWRYNLREYTTSSASSLSGWTKYDTVRTSWGPTQGPVYSDPNNGYRNVWSEPYIVSSNYKTVYKYYRYAVNKTGGYGSYAQSSSYPNYYEYTFDSPLSSNGTAGGHTKYQYWYSISNWISVYDQWTEQQWVSDNYSTSWYYQEPVYTYYYYRDLTKESTSDPTGQANVSSVVKYVTYREK